MHRATPQFWRLYDQLPEEARRLADRSFSLLKKNPRHPSLHFKKLGRHWSVRIGRAHRALAVPDGTDFTWVWIGRHADYDELLKRR
jgi:hypothetical protein